MNLVASLRPCLRFLNVNPAGMRVMVFPLPRRLDSARSLSTLTLYQRASYLHPLFVIQPRRCTSSLTRSKPLSKGVLRLLQQAKPERFKLSLAVLFLCVSSSVMIAFPFCVGKVIDVIYTSATEDELRRNLRWICQLLGGIVVVAGFANFGRVYLMNTSAQRIINAIRCQVHASIMRQEVAFFDTTRTGDLLTRLSSDTSLVGMSLTQNISDGLRSALAVVGGISMMVYTSPQLSLVALSIVPPIAIISVVFARRLKQVATKVQTSLAQSSATAEEQFSNIRTIRSFAKEDHEMQLYSEKLLHLLKVIKDETLLRAIFFGSTGATGNLVVLTVLYYGGVLMTQGHITVGTLSSFLLYAAYVGVSIGGLGGFVTETAKAVGASQRVWEIIDRQPKLPMAGGKTLSGIVGHVEFCELSFSYPSRQDYAIFDRLNLTIPAGSVTAVVGPSGQGKSTLAALLLRLYDPTHGKVTIDGIDIRELDPKFLRTHISIVSQEPILFSTTIYENILYGAVDPARMSPNDVIAAAKEANALDFIEGFPEGMNTLVGERGILLSGGQKQRIAIARAILRNPKVLILDEATSSLDSVSERAIQGALQTLMQGRTVLTIAHRLSTIKQAKQIAVLKGGKIVELGTYSSLLTVPNGLFKTLVEHQTA
ncbi:ATP-binding cassette sub-family B member 10, mitochondrial-like [Ornithodoros turicata]|uniref:ATP-binding cassette sub-family B member 10, mitochondrial-like n=1 Tax=Ornithodoros turicata TaxID=34597 RepID=UPI003138C69D